MTEDEYRETLRMIWWHEEEARRLHKLVREFKEQGGVRADGKFRRRLEIGPFQRMIQEKVGRYGAAAVAELVERGPREVYRYHNGEVERINEATADWWCTCLGVRLDDLWPERYG